MDPTLAAIFTNMGNAKPPRARFNFIKEGRHLVTLVNYGLKNTDKGRIVAVKLMSLDSQVHKPGELIDNAVSLYKTGWQLDDEYTRGAAFVRALINPALSAEECAVRAGQLTEPGCPGRGLVVIAHVTMVPLKNPKPGKEFFANITWEHVPNQAPEQVAKLRAHIESSVPPDVLAYVPLAPVAAPVAPPWQAPVYTPPAAPQWGGSANVAPAPSYAPPASNGNGTVDYLNSILNK